MKTIIGIGNPGKMYKLTRHNAGVMFIDYLNENNFSDYKLRVSPKFMNSSGEVALKEVRYSNVDLDDLYIAHDDLDIPLGEYKITKKAPKVHNGINDITTKLQSEEYWKIRIGIDNRNPENRTKGEDYVLQNFTKQELDKLQEVFRMISDDLL